MDGWEGTPVFGEHISCIIITIGVVRYSPLCVREWIVNNAKETLCRILATANLRNLAKRWRLSCKPRMRSADSIPIVSTSVCFLPLKMYTGIFKILEFEYKTDFFFKDTS